MCYLGLGPTPGSMPLEGNKMKRPEVIGTVVSLVLGGGVLAFLTFSHPTSPAVTPTHPTPVSTPALVPLPAPKPAIPEPVVVVPEPPPPVPCVLPATPPKPVKPEPKKTKKRRN